MRVIIEKNYDDMSLWAASYIRDKINNAKKGGPFVLGLPTGSSPIGTYRCLIEMYRRGTLSFKNVVTFNMDEYVGLSESHKESYHTFMRENFFDHVDILKENIHMLDGESRDPELECKDYEQKIQSYGGIDLFLGGIGADGHIAFNEPYSSLSSRTRVKDLTMDTKIMNSRFFDGDISKVPSRALTVGVSTIMDSREVMILANGHSKARALRHAIEDSISQKWPASALQEHKRAIFVVDESAAGELSLDTVRYFLQIENKSLII